MNKTCQKGKWCVSVTLLQYYYVLLIAVLFLYCICVYVFVSLMHPKDFSTVAGTVRPSILRQCCGSVRTSNQLPDKKKKKGEGGIKSGHDCFLFRFPPPSFLPSVPSLRSSLSYALLYLAPPPSFPPSLRPCPLFMNSPCSARRPSGEVFSMQPLSRTEPC